MATPKTSTSKAKAARSNGKRGGRPPIPEKRRLTEMNLFRLRKGEQKRMEEATAMKGQSVSMWVRDLVLDNLNGQRTSK